MAVSSSGFLQNKNINCVDLYLFALHLLSLTLSLTSRTRDEEERRRRRHAGRCVEGLAFADSDRHAHIHSRSLTLVMADEATRLHHQRRLPVIQHHSTSSARNSNFSNSRSRRPSVDPVTTTSSSRNEVHPNKLAISERTSATRDDLFKASTTSTYAPASTSRASALQSLRKTLRRPKSQRLSISTTGTSVVTVVNGDEVGTHHEDSARQRQCHSHQPSKHRGSHLDDEEEDIAILQPEEEESAASPETRTRRWRRSFSNMRMAISRSASVSAAKKKAAPIMYSISFYPWKRDPRAYYSNPEAAAEWVPDTASKRCQICLTSFNLTRRRHHCRICGLLACNDCSLQRTYFPFSKDSRSQHHLIKDGAPQRTCNACAGTLKNMAAQSDPRVKQFTVHPPVANPFGMRDDDSEDSDAHNWRVSIGDEDIYVVDSSKRGRLQLALASSGTSQIQSDELDEVLRARAQSRKNPQPKYYVVNSVWLEQWLQYVHIDAPPKSHGIPSQKERPAPHTRAPRNARRPGPISNYALLNFVSGKLIPKQGLERSRGNDAGGDYRIVSEEVWMVFLRHYGGGPCIQLRPDDHSPKKANQSALVPKNSALNEGGCNGPTDASRWVIVEIDDTIPPLIASEPADLLKGNKKMRRVASASSLHRRQSDNMRHMSSVHPFHETAPCIMWDVEERPQQRRDRRPLHDTAPCYLRDTGERSLPYYPRDSIVNCITSPPSASSAASKKKKKAGKPNQVRHLDWQQSQHQPTKQPTSEARRSRTNSFSSGSTRSATKVSVGTVLYYEPAKKLDGAPSVSTDDDLDSDSDHTPRATIAAVSAFALAAAEARKKSAKSLSRHASALSSSMVAAHSSASA